MPAIPKLGLNDVLFLITILNTRSSSAFECGNVNTSLATFESLGNIVVPSGFLAKLFYEAVRLIPYHWNYRVFTLQKFVKLYK